jgi:glyoxylase I family protein
MTNFPGIGHVALTVSDLRASADWYGQLFGTEPVLDEDVGAFHHIVYSVGGTLVGLHGHPTTSADDRFDEHRLGLDHVAFGCEDRSQLEQWVDRLDALGVAHGGIVDAPYGSGLSFRDPDGIALEFFAPPSA